jgi:ABC-type branched-subunit amino acid transport system substrate-binding protein
MKAAALILSATLSLAAHASERILIGQSAPLTGPAAVAGKAFVDGAKVYIDEVNRAGGVHGRQIELRTLDDADDPKRATTNANSLVDAGAIALFGFVDTPTATAGAEVAHARHVPFVAPASGATVLRQQDKDMVFNVRASFKDEAKRIAAHAKTTGLQRVSFFSVDLPESKVVFDHLGQHLSRAGLKVFSSAHVQPGAMDLAKAVAELKPAETQAVVMFCPGKVCTDMIHEVRNQGGRHVAFYAVSAAGDVFGPLAEQGVSIAVTQVMPYPWVAGPFPVVMHYQKAMTQAGHKDFGYWSLEGYVSARVLVEGLRRMHGAPSATALTSAMRAMGKLDIGGFEVSLRNEADEHHGFTEITLASKRGHYRH